MSCLRYGRANRSTRRDQIALELLALDRLRVAAEAVDGWVHHRRVISALKLPGAGGAGPAECARR